VSNHRTRHPYLMAIGVRRRMTLCLRVTSSGGTHDIGVRRAPAR
jgi:hypothetical protein